MHPNDIANDFAELNRVFEQFAGEVFGFVQVCGVGEPFRAEQIVVDTLKEATNRGDFQDPELEIIPLRERLLTDAYRMAMKNIHPLAETEFERFFSLPQIARAAIYLRHRVGLTFIQISRVLSVPEKEVREATLAGRQQLLGRPLKTIDWGF